MSDSMLDTSTILPELRSRDLLPGDTAGVFASGSLVRGWGNSMSDVDVHVISGSQHDSPTRKTTHVALDPSALVHESIFVGERRWDVEYWTSAQVDQLLDKVSWESYESPETPWAALTRSELGMLERLPYAVAADDGFWLTATRRRLHDSAHKVVLVGISLRESDGYVEDAAGALEAGDLNSAVLAARMAFDHAVDAFQAWGGQFGSLWPKWRARRMSLINSPVLPFEQYWSTETMATFDRENPRAWVEETIGVCRKISAELQV